MQFAPDTPDIPDELLQAHEEGRVVFFCGAGISYPAGLPSFKGLVEKIYKLTHTKLSEKEKQAFEREQFDVTLNLLEQRLPEQRIFFRSALAKALEPKLDRKGATDTQAALLRLARSREGSLRLVTTNFDRIFHSAAERIKQPFRSYDAPMLPIPKNSRWNGLVHLHGLLPAKQDETILNNLVVTSGDFGLAYLTEGWAARFVSALFRNYVVCFVGYSISDPVMRYIMDALATDRMLGEITQQAWALGACEPGQEDHKRKTLEWQVKGVKPILYQKPTDSHDHSALHNTLHAWADSYRDRVTGKESIVVRHALARPSASAQQQQDDFIGGVFWALSDKSGLPAKSFANFNPCPSLDWLDVFLNKERQDTYLARSLRSCISPREEPWDEVMRHLADWLVRHLDDSRLVIWLTQLGGQLHSNFQQLIRRKLDDFARLEREGKTAELEQIRSQAPRAIPGPLMRTLWRLLLSGRVKSQRNTYWSNTNFYCWKDCWKERLEQDGLTATLRLELRELLAPQVTLEEPLYWGDEIENTDEPSLWQLVHWQLMLAANQEALCEVLCDQHWVDALPLLLEDIQHLLCDALDLLRELGKADEHEDPSRWYLPSIISHPQNRFYNWVILIEMLRDAWLAVCRQDGERATRIAQEWFRQPYPTFKRLALFAASKGAFIASDQWVEWLLVDGAWWLWSPSTEQEVFSLLELQGQQLAEPTQERLEAAILNGPLREMYEMYRKKPDVDYSVWMHLAKLNKSGLALGATAKARLAELSSIYPRRVSRTSGTSDIITLHLKFSFGRLSKIRGACSITR
ncbi:hypothetical protein OMCYN_01599 [cyanobiont of Ornithocercus magnificus]|nr:hypothetical protein OMCYN_01599 [cyanobiont of Ornithocercus magnificus]